MKKKKQKNKNKKIKKEKMLIQANKKIPEEYFKHPAGGVYINDRMLNLFLPLMKEQKFILKHMLMD